MGIFLPKLLILPFPPHEKPHTVMAIIPCRINLKYSIELAKVWDVELSAKSAS